MFNRIRLDLMIKKYFILSFIILIFYSCALNSSFSDNEDESTLSDGQEDSSMYMLESILEDKTFIMIDFNNLINKNFGLFTIENVRNYGAAFSIFYGKTLFLSSISIIISIILITFILRKNNLRTNELIAYSLILGGTIGNG